MNISDIIYYTVAESGRKTVSLRTLCLREEFDLESVFYAVRDAVDMEDLLNRLHRVCLDTFEVEKETDSYIRIVVHTADGNTNYLKLKKRREQ